MSAMRRGDSRARWQKKHDHCGEAARVALRARRGALLMVMVGEVGCRLSWCERELFESYGTIFGRC